MILSADLEGDPVLQEYRNQIIAYAGDCVLEQASALDSKVINIFTNTVNGHTLDALAPAKIGIRPDMSITYNNLTYSCQNFFTQNLENNATGMATLLYDNFKKDNGST